MTQTTDSLEAPVPLASTQVESVTALDFFSLSRAVQDRFLSSATGTGVPAATLFAPAPKVRGLAWLAFAIVAPLGSIALLALGFGQLSHRLALQPVYFVGFHAALGGFAALAVAGYALARGHAARFPYHLGQYIFPFGIVDASSEMLRIYRFAGLLTVTHTGKRAVFKFPERSFEFQLPADMSFEELERWVESSKAKYSEAMVAQNRRDLAVLDPLRDSGFSNPLSSNVPRARPRERRALRFLLALLVGALSAGLLFFARNKLGERLIYKAATEANTAPAYTAYLARGGKRPEVKETLLPIAELNQARGSLAAVERYAEEHPGSAIAPQIEHALREEMLKELGAVREAGTLRAILDFQSAHPRHALVAPELAQARKAVYAAAIKQYRETSAAGPRVKEFFVDLIRHSEKQGPEVLVRFRRDIPDSAERADASIRKSAYYVGASGLPSQYFNAEHSRPREQDSSKKIIEGLQAQFSPEVLSFNAGEPLEGGGELPAAERPTLFITYRPEMSGGYTTQRPRGVYVGIGFMVYTQFMIPGHNRPLNLKKQSWWLPPDVTQIWRDQLSTAQVYDQSAREGFNRYVEKLLTVLHPTTEPAAEGETDIQEVAEVE